MSVLKLLLYPDTRLNLKAKEVIKFDHELKVLVNNMFETMYYFDGCGLAATQVNVQLRVIVLDISTSEEEKNPMVIINPTILSLEESIIYNEGCLSFPTISVNIERKSKLELKYFDIEGNEKYLKCDGLLSHCIQHEIDHLNGVVIADYVSDLKKSLIIKRMKKFTYN